MSIIPTIEGDKNPYVGFVLQYELIVDNLYSVRWRMLNKDGTPLDEKSRLFFEKLTTPCIHFKFIDGAAKQDKILEAWYKVDEHSSERRVAISITPNLGSPAILTAIWQDAKGQKITDFSLETVYLAIRTVNIPVGRKLRVLLYDEEIIKDKLAKEVSVSVGANGKSRLKITNGDWLTIRSTLKSEKILPGEDKQYQIYARVLYDPNAVYGHTAGTGEVGFTTSILIMNNDRSKSLEVLTKEIESANKSVVVNVPDKNIQEEKIPVNLRIDIYFDGTMNNRWNIDAKREPYKILDDGETAMEKIKRNKAEGMLTEKDSSYDQAYTNIPIMFDLDKAETTEKQFKIYVEGVGTRKYENDVVLLGSGLGTDMGGTGIPSKKQRMLDEIKAEVQLDDKETPDEVQLVVFGFSRGAATARSFLSHRRDIARVLETSEANISFEFVGIFDTVSSVLIPSVQSVVSVRLLSGMTIPMPVLDKESVKTANNVKELNLAIGANAKRVVHLTAGDEYRSFFRLTDIVSSINAGVGFELKLPGSHCDVGGGDADNLIEYVETDNYRGLADRLVEEGWHTNKKHEIIEVPNTSNISIPNPHPCPEMGIGDYVVPSHIPQTIRYVKRTVRAGYHKIPMSIMIHFAERYTKVEYKPLNHSYSIPEDLTELADRMLSFAKQQSGKRQASAMHILEEPQFKWVRNKYLHLSAFPESGKTDITAIVKDTILGRNLKEGFKDWFPFAEGDYSKRPIRGINEG